MVRNIPPVEAQSTISSEKEPENDTPEQILDKIIAAAGSQWSESEQAAVRSAYELASFLHADDKYRNRPYTYHLVRNASRIVRELHVNDCELVVAVLLHDSVEDHADAIVALDDRPIPDDPAELQESALGIMAELTSKRSAGIVRALTNTTRMSGIGAVSEEERMRRLEEYGGHVELAVNDQDTGIWMGKFVDWVDNGVNIDKAEKMKRSRQRRLIDKYELIMPILKERYYLGVKETLDSSAQEYVENMFVEGLRRLSQMKQLLVLGSGAINSK